jgi:hypothetical protein
MLRQRNQSQKDKYHISFHKWNIEKIKRHESRRGMIRNDEGCQGKGGEGIKRGKWVDLNMLKAHYMHGIKYPMKSMILCNIHS